ncbi:Cro/CI family transcriptional regulator [Klebsiella pneumoniae]|nr:Cro/CI family transcriptional regulator [Klebsiella pneumoniae]
MNIAQHLAATLKTLRQQRGWSLSRLAEETGVSKAMLGQIERNESSPTVATLWKIATGPERTVFGVHRPGRQRRALRV